MYNHDNAQLNIVIVGDFKREDLAASLLTTTCLQVMHMVYLSAIAHGCRQVYLTGNFVSSATVRRFMTTEMIHRFTYLQSKDVSQTTKIYDTICGCYYSGIVYNAITFVDVTIAV